MRSAAELRLRGDDNPATAIVGVIAASRTNDLSQQAEPEVYVPLWQQRAFSKHLVVRSTAAPETVAAQVRSALREVAPTAAVESPNTLDEIRGESVATRSFAMQLLMGFAVIACVLTLGGIYSVLSLSVVARRRELAIRSAIGAERGTILGLVMRQGLRMIAAGAVIGVLGSIALSSLLQAQLFGVEPFDPVTMLGAAALFIAIGLAVCFAPARRAAAVEAVEALKGE